MSVLIKNVSIVTMTEPELVYGYVLIKDGMFHTVNSGEPTDELISEVGRIVNGQGKWLLPGLINTHGHKGMALLRGHSDDLPLHRWLEEKMWPFEAKQDRQAVRAGRDMAMAEMILSGTTTFLEMYHLFMDDFAERIEEVGMRASLMRSMIGLCPKSEQEAKLDEAKLFAKQWHKKASGRIQTMLAPHAPYTCPPDFIERIVEEARHMSIPVHMHLAETQFEVNKHQEQYGIHPFDHLEEMGLLSNVHWLFAHGVYLEDTHLDRMKEYDLAVSYNPVSNLKLGSGVARVDEMLRKGLTVGIGTDSVASNNTLDLFEELRMGALIQKGQSHDPTTLQARDALKMGTVNGAKALQFENLGKIEKGYEADFVLVAPNEVHLQPKEHIISHLVYATKGTDVTDVYVKGKPLLENRELLTLDKERIVFEANEEYQRILQK
ncbi:amidohydrolase [Bacillus suaedae]|uniref:5-methylthioadenosine/S-adenosylhomocysteine deaminase n=1 Tax=Halalkalibacter suaedae TaxID=2822140 RepID=A0A940WY54_9BACI|nr:amidohydrolase [Bacillus suaedae]